ncbi:uncharacterized protein IAS62_004075 [Cryptococcus decagattii]|uniref:HIG1 domain-containing protein n=1 Tax=Cryptococcus decagattii TaxID=1859122 RepID=A0ABZ2AZV8_9TREE
MKAPTSSSTQDDMKVYYNEALKGGFRGALFAAAITGTSYFVFSKRSPTFRSLPLPAKAFAGVVISVPCIFISAERAALAYERTHWSGVGQKEIERKLERQSQTWEKMTQMEKAKNWASIHKYSLISAAWVGSLGLAFGIVARNPYQSTAQKIVQARMWAQGLTVGLLVGGALLAGANSNPPDEFSKVKEGDHSWRDILELDEHLTKEERAQLHGNADPKKVKEIHEAALERKAAAGKP